MSEHESSKSKSMKTKSPNKLLLKQIRDQMEFYFSDSNLSKDRFLKKEISKTESGYIDLNIFLNFNKIYLLCTDLNILAKALNKSEFLELDANATQVKRRTPFVESSQSEIDERTVYVENLPSNVDHELLKAIFNRCGKVTYVSLPKFKSSKQIKGFAFIEFDSKNSADNAIKMINDPNVEDENKAGIFPKYNKQLIDLEEKLQRTGHLVTNINSDYMVDNAPKQHELTDKNEDIENDKKRKLLKSSDSSFESTNEPSRKELKLEDANEVNNDQLIDSSDQNETFANENEKRKKKTRRRKHTNTSAKKIEKELQEEATLLHLRVLSKKVWLSLKQEYLQKQKQNLANLKEKLKLTKVSHIGDAKKTHEIQKSKKHEKIKLDKAVEPIEIDETKILDKEKLEQSGCIVRLIAKDVTKNLDHLYKLTKLQFKNDVLNEFNEQIAYVDVDKNTNKIFVRFKNSQLANDFLSLKSHNNSTLNDFNKICLSQNEEMEYLNRIEQARKKKQIKNANKIRGKSKLLDKFYNTVYKENENQETNEKKSDETFVKLNTEIIKPKKASHIQFEDD